MSTHKFVVTIPNSTTKAAGVQLKLVPAEPKEYAWLNHPGVKSKLEVVDKRIVLDPCDKGKPELKLELEPLSTIQVHIVINTNTGKKAGVTGFHLVDIRQGKPVGGVLLLCAHPTYKPPKPKVVKVPNMCPAVLAKPLYTIWPGADPSKAASHADLEAGRSLELVAQITNSKERPLHNARVYLENMGHSKVTFVPGTYSMGTLQRGNVFYATWKINADIWQEGSFEPDLVVSADNFVPTRINGSLRFKPKPKPKPRPDPKRKE